MPLTEEQIQSIKKQILKQVENFPQEQKEIARKQVEEMNAEQLEQFLIQNNLIKQKENSDQGTEPGECIFCSIIQGKTPSYKIDENKSAIAILDINPLSKGQSLIIPKKHETIEKLPSSVLSLSKKTAKKLKSKLKPKTEEVKIETSSIGGHGIVSIIPLYKDKKLERKKAKPEELKELQEKLINKKRTAKTKQTKKISKEDISRLPFAPIRIP